MNPSAGREVSAGQKENPLNPWIEQVASAGHEDWRASRRQSKRGPFSKKFEPRVKVLIRVPSSLGKKSEEKWVNADQIPPGAKVLKKQDIANTPFNKLDPHWQKENVDSATVATVLVGEALQAKNALDEAFIEQAANRLHAEWLGRAKASGGWVPPEQDKPYAELSDGEKEKDRIWIHRAIDTALPKKRRSPFDY